VKTVDLSIEIKMLREKMILTGMTKGLTAPETVQLSQRLDNLLNIRQKRAAIEPLPNINIPKSEEVMITLG
jgi:hypothetical protein